MRLKLAKSHDSTSTFEHEDSTVRTSKEGQCPLMPHTLEIGSPSCKSKEGECPLMPHTLDIGKPSRQSEERESLLMPNALEIGQIP